MVPVLSVVFMILSILGGVAIPLGLFLYFRRRFGCHGRSFFVGCAVMLLFALVLEALAHRLILSSAAGAVIQATPWLTALYGGLMAGLFEESGRFLAFKTVLKKLRGNDHEALMYGAGHGGFEALYVLLTGMITNLVFAVMINSGQTAALTAGLSGAQLASVEAGIAAMTQTAPAIFLAALLERLAAVAAQLSLSVLVWFAAKRGGKSLWLFPLAILLHLALDAVAVLLNGVLPSLLLVEAAVWLMAALLVCLARIVWKRQRPAEDGADSVADN